MTIVMLAPEVVADEAAYAARRADEADLLAQFPGIEDVDDVELIAVVADPAAAAELGDPDEAAAAAVIVLERRLSGVCPRRPN